MSEEETFPTVAQAIRYEVCGAAWLFLIPFPDLVVRYLVWKVERKFKMIEGFNKHDVKQRILHPEEYRDNG